MAKKLVRVGALVEHETTGEIGTIIGVDEYGDALVRWNFGGKNYESPADLIFLR